MPLNLCDVILAEQWAITPESLTTILAIARREHLDPEAVAAKLGRKLDNTRAVELRDGVAVIPVMGPIFRYANLLTEVSGATSLAVVARDLNEAVSNESVKAILLNIDSPGGQVTGTGEFAGMVRALCAKKPIHAYVGGTGGSAAYWIASACETITAAPTAILGSIGVLAAFRKGAEDEITIVSDQSPNKQPDVGAEEGQAEVRKTLNALAEVFVADVARHRGVSAETVLADFGKGGVLVGRAAVKVGMADRIGTYEGTVRRLASGSPLQRRGMAAEGEWDAEACMEAAPPETISSDPPAGRSFEAEVEALLASADLVITRAEAVQARRETEGRRLSAARREQLAQARERFTALLARTEPRADAATVRRLQAESSALDAAYVRFLGGE